MVGTRLAAVKIEPAAVVPTSAAMVCSRARPSTRLTTLPSMIASAAVAIRRPAMLDAGRPISPAAPLVSTGSAAPDAATSGGAVSPPALIGQTADGSLPRAQPRGRTAEEPRGPSSVVQQGRFRDLRL